MKILVVSPSTARGGAEGYMATFAREATARGHEVVAALEPTAALDGIAAEIAAAGVTVHRASIEAPGLLRLIPRVRRLRRLVRDIGPDAVHLTLPWPDQGLAVMLACARQAVPLAVVFQLVAEPLRPGWRLPLYRWARARRQRWIAVSDANRRILERTSAYARPPIAVVHNGADAVATYEGDLRDELGVPRGTPLVITVGRLDARQKGHDLILAIAPKVLRACPDVRFVWVGDGPDRPRLRALAEAAGVADSIVFLGSRTDAPRLISSATLGLFPSRYEGLPFSVLESMHAGVPVVAARAGGIPEVVRDGEDGVVVDVGDAAALQDAVIRLLGDEEARRRMGASARSRAAAFSIGAMVNATLAELRTVAGLAAPGRLEPETITVVVPTRNRSGPLRRALASVGAQTYRDLEILVIDDASTDDTPAILEELAAADPRIRVERTAAPVGPARARNRAIAVARGGAIAFLDDDDEWLPHKLERQLAVLAAGDADLVYAPYAFVDPDGTERIMGAVDPTTAEPLRLLAAGNFIGNSTVLARTDTLREVGGFDEAMPMIEDWELWLRIAARGRLAVVPEPLARIHHSAGGVTSRTAERVLACERIAHRLESLAAGDRALLGDGLYAVGFELLTHGEPARGRAYMRRSLRVRPWPPRRWIMVTVAHLGTKPYRALADAWGRRIQRRRMRRLAGRRR